MFGINPIDYIGAPKHTQRGEVYQKKKKKPYVWVKCNQRPTQNLQHVWVEWCDFFIGFAHAYMIMIVFE